MCHNFEIKQLFPTLDLISSYGNKEAQITVLHVF